MTLSCSLGTSTRRRIKKEEPNEFCIPREACSLFSSPAGDLMMAGWSRSNDASLQLTLCLLCPKHLLSLSLEMRGCNTGQAFLLYMWESSTQGLITSTVIRVLLRHRHTRIHMHSTLLIRGSRDAPYKVCNTTAKPHSCEDGDQPSHLIMVLSIGSTSGLLIISVVMKESDGLKMALSVNILDQRRGSWKKANRSFNMKVK